MMTHPADAEDALQDAYLKAYRALTSGQFDGRSDVQTWLYRIAANACLDALRKRERRGKETLSDHADEAVTSSPVSGNAEAWLALRELDEWLRDLPVEQRAALVLSTVEGLSNAETAATLGISEGAVEQRLIRARAKLKQRRQS